MDLPKNVKQKFSILPKKTAQAIYPNIYIPKNVYQNLKSKNPNPKYISILVHEQAHIKRQKEQGFLLWVFKYIFSKNFRFNEEIIAIKESMKYMKKTQLKWNVRKTARQLSSYLYLWCVDYNSAKVKLDKVWKNI